MVIETWGRGGEDRGDGDFVQRREGGGGGGEGGHCN